MVKDFLPEAYRTYEQFAALGSIRSPWARFNRDPWAPICYIQQKFVSAPPPHWLGFSRDPWASIGWIQQKSVVPHWLDLRRL
jgi:hypothetical protein